MEILSEVKGRLSAKGYQTNISSGRHQLLADEPEALGGDDAGPDPYALLLSSLIACTTITLRMYAQRKHWPLENVQVECRLIRKDAESGPFIERKIYLKGDALAEDQKARLLQIADACPVHKLLKGIMAA
jgi:putative redox protein